MTRSDKLRFLQMGLISIHAKIQAARLEASADRLMVIPDIVGEGRSEDADLDLSLELMRLVDEETSHLLSSLIP